MNRVFSSLPFLLILLLLASGCGPEPSATPPPTIVPTETALPAPSPTHSPAPTEQPTQVPTTEPAPAAPPDTASLGELWVRPADGMVMTYVPVGEFEMGSNDPFYNNERPPHRVVVDGFWLDQTEVTNAQYQMCVQAGACKPPDASGSFSRDRYYGEDAYGDFPVLYVNWYRAVAYCQWVGGRLPTEEEWEYAARGPDSRWFPWGDAPDRTRMNYCDVNCPLAHADLTVDDGHADTSPVGNYPAGASWSGALDMVGNVWEWIWDWYGFYPSEDNPDWLAPDMNHRVMRGGGWDTDADHARCTFRSWFDPAQSQDSIGFRCVLSLEIP